LNPGQVKSKVEKVSTATSLLSIHHKGLDHVCLTQCQFICGMVLWCADTLKPGPVTADLTTVIHSYKSLINNIKLVHSLTQSVIALN